MKRYKLKSVILNINGDTDHFLDEDPDGEWVKWDDIKTEVWEKIMKVTCDAMAEKLVLSLMTERDSKQKETLNYEFIKTNQEKEKCDVKSQQQTENTDIDTQYRRAAAAAVRYQRGD